MRTVLSSVAHSQESGRQMAREAKQRRFYEAKSRAFLGDGLPWNWSIWKAEGAEAILQVRAAALCDDNRLV
jgi:hypothetical protein